MLLLSLLTGCLAGPNFYRPRTPKCVQYTPHPHPKKTVTARLKGSVGQSQHFIECARIPKQWWALFHSNELNYLICQGIRKNPTLAAARSTLVEANENVNVAIGTNLMPQVDAQFNGQRQRFTNLGGDNFNAGIFNLFNTSVNVSYALDIFGGAQREIEGLKAQVHYQYYQLQAAYLTLTSNIVTTSITIASLKEQILATKQLIRAQEKYLQIVRQQFEVGGTSAADIASQENLLATTQASLHPLEQSLMQNLHLLSILIGEFPCQDCLPTLSLDRIILPTHIPLSIPSCLVRQRPDILSAEALLHQATAQIGVATANLFPKLTLTGSYGWQSNVLSSLIRPNNVVWDYGAQVLQPIFQGGALLAQRRATIAAFKTACSNYRVSVLQGFKNVADSLRALENDAKTLRDQTRAEAAARRSLFLTTKQFELGGASYLALLIAQREFQQARINLIRAKAARYTDTAALFQSLGGGWWNAC